MLDWMGVECGGDGGDTQVARHCDSPAYNRLVAKVTPIEVTQCNHRAAQLRRQQAAAFNPDDRLTGPAR